MKLHDVGAKAKEVYGESKLTEPAEDNGVMYPELHLSGALAENMGAANLKDGDRIRMMVDMEVKRLTKTEEGGETSYTMTLCIKKASDPEKSEGDDDESEEEDDDTDDAPSPAMSYIESRAAKG